MATRRVSAPERPYVFEMYTGPDWKGTAIDIATAIEKAEHDTGSRVSRGCSTDATTPSMTAPEWCRDWIARHRPLVVV